jgi:hypothetical protein
MKRWYLYPLLKKRVALLYLLERNCGWKEVDVHSAGRLRVHATLAKDTAFSLHEIASDMSLQNSENKSISQLIKGETLQIIRKKQ